MFSLRRHNASGMTLFECSVLISDIACKCNSQIIKQQLSKMDSTVLFKTYGEEK